MLKNVDPMTADELSDLLGVLSTCSKKAAILAVMPGFSHQLKPKSLSPTLPDVLTSVYDPESMKLSLPELINRCKEIQLHVTVVQLGLT